MVVQTTIDAVVQLILFSIIPFLWWFFSARRKENLLTWIGLVTPKFDNKPRALISWGLIPRPSGRFKNV